MLFLSRLISVLLNFKIPFQLSNLLTSLIQFLLLLLDELIIFVLLLKILFSLFLYDRFFVNLLYGIFNRLFFLFNRLLLVRGWLLLLFLCGLLLIFDRLLLLLLRKLLLLFDRLLLLVLRRLLLIFDRLLLLFNFCQFFLNRLSLFLNWFFLDLFLLFNRVLFNDICFGLLRIRVDFLLLGLSSFFCLCSIHRDLFYLRLIVRHDELICLCLLSLDW